MATGLQRGRVYSETYWERSSAGNLLEDENIYDWVKGLLDPEEHLLFPADYVDNWTLYDRVTGYGYFIRDDNAPNPAGLDFVWSKDLRRMEAEGYDMTKIRVVEKVLIVRQRLPWFKVETEWLINTEELAELGDDVEVLEIFTEARRKDEPDSEPRVLLSAADRLSLETNPDDWEITDVKYLIAWKMSPETRKALLR